MAVPRRPGRWGRRPLVVPTSRLWGSSSRHGAKLSGPLRSAGAVFSSIAWCLDARATTSTSCLYRLRLRDGAGRRSRGSRRQRRGSSTKLLGQGRRRRRRRRSGGSERVGQEEEEEEEEEGEEEGGRRRTRKRRRRRRRSWTSGGGGRTTRSRKKECWGRTPGPSRTCLSRTTGPAALPAVPAVLSSAPSRPPPPSWPSRPSPPGRLLDLRLGRLSVSGSASRLLHRSRVLPRFCISASASRTLLLLHPSGDGCPAESGVTSSQVTVAKPPGAPRRLR